MQALFPDRPDYPRTRGMSLVELLVSLTVAAVVTAYAVPSLRVVIANNQQTSIINRFVSSVLLARSIAITQHTEAIICPSVNGETCDDDNDWSQGWIVMTPALTDGFTDNEATSVVRVEQHLENVSLSANRAMFHFRPRGLRATNGTAIMCKRHATRAKAVIVSYNGRPRTSLVLANGDPIPCDPVPG